MGLRRLAARARGAASSVRAAHLDAWPLVGSAASGIGVSDAMTLVADVERLALVDARREEHRRVTWRDVEGWDLADPAAAGRGDVAIGPGRMLLTVRTRDGALAALVEARQVPAFLTALEERRAEAAARARAVRRRRYARPVGALAGALVLVASLAAVLSGHLASPRSVPSARRVSHHSLRRARLSSNVHLAKASVPPAPSPRSLQSAPLAAHEAFGFLPYWELVNPGADHLASLSTIAYFGVDVTAAGTVDERASNAGWAGYESQALADVVTQAHRRGARVVLSATCFDQAALDALTHDPAAQSALAATLVTLVQAKHLDGVNLDFEGTGPTDRAGLDQLVETLGTALHQADAAWQFTVDTYASSAADPLGFYDVAGMAPYVDAFVVMDYDMGDTFSATPSVATYSDQSVVAAYVSAAGASKVILGMALYGEQWPTTGPAAGDPATGPPTAVPDSAIAASAEVYWDPATQGPWAAYRVGGQWYQVWFDDPAALAAKARLSVAAGLRGQAVWALGMSTGTGDVHAALTGVSTVPQPPVGPMVSPDAGMPAAIVPTSPALPLAGSTGASSIAAPGTQAGASSNPSTPGPTTGGSSGGATVTARYDGTTVTLVAWPGPPPAATSPAGTLSALSATEGALTCLTGAGPLAVVRLDGTSAFLVRTSTPAQCVDATWAFVVPAASSAASSSSSTAGASSASPPASPPSSTRTATGASTGTTTALSSGASTSGTTTSGTTTSGTTASGTTAG